MLHHEQAFANADRELERLAQEFRTHTGCNLQRIEIKNSELSLADAVASYFFNSQIVSPRLSGKTDSPRMLIICPQQCSRLAPARRLVDRLIQDPAIPIDAAQFVSLDESMANGGGPACLRLRVQLDLRDLAELGPMARIDERRLDRLRQAIQASYPSELEFQDLRNPEFIGQAVQAVEAVRQAMRHA